MGLVVRDDGWRIPGWLWERMEPLLPAPPPHPLGCHRPRVPNRDALDAILLVLRTGMQWNALNATGVCSSSAAHRPGVGAGGRVPRVLAAGAVGLRRGRRDRLVVAGSGRRDDQGPFGRSEDGAESH